jgi:hypothetical protein
MVYLAPLFVFTSPLTGVRGYMLVGTCLCLPCLSLVISRATLERPLAAACLMKGVVTLTGWGTIESVFYVHGPAGPFSPPRVADGRG